MSQILVNISGSPFYFFHVLFSAILGYWVYLDATERESNANLLWAIGCTVFQPLTVGYLLYRSQIGGRTEPAGIGERLIGTYAVGHLIAAQLWFALRFTDVISTTVYPPLVELQYYVVLLIIGAVPGYWLVWKRGWSRIRRRLGWVQESERTEVHA